MMRNIPTITRYLLIINVIAFFVALGSGASSVYGYGLNQWLGLHFFMATDFHMFQLLTYMFMHGSFEHLFFNMFALWMFGCVVERTWGPRKFIVYYLVCGIGAGLLQELAQFISFYMNISAQSDMAITNVIHWMSNNGSIFNQYTTVGASGAIYGILLAFGMLYPNERIFLFPIPIPIKAKWFVAGYALIEVFMALNSSGDNVAHLAHLGGMLFGFLLIKYWQRHPKARFVDESDDPLLRSMRNKWVNRYEQNTRKWHAAKTVDTETSEKPSATVDTQEEINVILDKIRKNGYASLTREEKELLFRQQN